MVHCDVQVMIIVVVLKRGAFSLHCVAFKVIMDALHSVLLPTHAGLCCRYAEGG